MTNELKSMKQAESLCISQEMFIIFENQLLNLKKHFEKGTCFHGVLNQMVLCISIH